jgi:hypothetical protein
MLDVGLSDGTGAAIGTCDGVNGSGSCTGAGLETGCDGAGLVAGWFVPKYTEAPWPSCQFGGAGVVSAGAAAAQTAVRMLTAMNRLVRNMNMN